MRNYKKYLLLSLAVAGVFLTITSGAAAQPGVVAHTGTLPVKASYLIEVPANWNGTLFLYSHGYVVPGSANPTQDVGDPATRFFMLASGFALAGSSYATTGWAIQQALPDQIAVPFNIFPGPAGGIVPAAPAFVEFHPHQYLRPFDADDKDHDRD